MTKAYKYNSIRFNTKHGVNKDNTLLRLCRAKYNNLLMAFCYQEITFPSRINAVVGQRSNKQKLRIEKTIVESLIFISLPYGCCFNSLSCPLFTNRIKDSPGKGPIKFWPFFGYHLN